MPLRAASGEVTLKLVAVANLRSVLHRDGTAEEARVVEVDVDAE